MAFTSFLALVILIFALSQLAPAAVVARQSVSQALPAPRFEGEYADRNFRHSSLSAWRFKRNGEAEPLPQGLQSTEQIVDQFRRFAIWSVLLSCIFSYVLFAKSNVSLDPSGTYVYDWLLATALLISRTWWGRAGHRRVADMLGTISVAALGGMACGAMAMLSLPLHLPLADHTFLAIDQAIGADSIAIVTKLASFGPSVFELTWLPYDKTLQLYFLSLLILSICGARVEAWRAAICFATTLLSVCLIAMFLPTKGVGVWGSREFFSLLPDSAMRGFWAHFDEFYQAPAPVLRLRAIDGVISFPSFHIIVGLIVVTMWRQNIVTFLAALGWFALMLPGTLIYGGHYVVDLIGGVSIWLFWFAATRRIEASCLRNYRAPAQHEWPALRIVTGGVVSRFRSPRKST